MEKNKENTNKQQESEPSKFFVLEKGSKSMTREEAQAYLDNQLKDKE